MLPRYFKSSFSIKRGSHFHKHHDKVKTRQITEGYTNYNHLITNKIIKRL